MFVSCKSEKISQYQILTFESKGRHTGALTEFQPVNFGAASLLFLENLLCGDETVINKLKGINRTALHVVSWPIG